MNNEKDYIKKTFHSNFNDFKDKNIVLYGLGFKTKIVLEEFSDYNFIGLMDPHKTGEEVYGKKVLSYDEVLDSNIDAIIVLARPNIVRVITRRILTFCQKNNIALYDMNKNDLSLGIEKLLVLDEPYLNLNETDIKVQIAQHKTISFDIFDTLLMRTVLEPQDVFEIVERRLINYDIEVSNFKQERREAERTLLLKTNPTIYEIYNYLQMKLSLTDEEKNTLLELELTTEKDLLIKRDKMVELMQFAIHSGKDVYLISDMYLPKKILEDILSKLGIRGYKDIYVSCEYRVPKCNGLFKLFKEDIISDSYLHIGDNEDADGIFAKMNGIDSFLIKSSLDMLELSSYREIFHHLRTINDRSLVGLFISRVFNNPFSLSNTNGRPVINSTYDVGYLFIAPIVTNYIDWILKEVKNEDYESILFAARDGYLIKNLYDNAIKLLDFNCAPPSIYFLTSRMICAASSMRTEEDIKYVASLPFAYSHEKLLEIRFGLEVDEILPFDNDIYVNLESYVLAHKQKIFQKSKDIRERYLKYIDSLNIKKGSNVAYFDLVSSGTCQMYLTDIVPFELSGLYFVHYTNEISSEKRDQLSIKALFKNGLSYQSQSYAFDNYHYLETIITSFDSSLASFDKNVSPVYSDESRSKKELIKLEVMHNAITDYFKFYIKNLYCLDVEINNKVSDLIFNFINYKYSDIKGDTLEEVILVDDFGVGKIEVIC